MEPGEGAQGSQRQLTSDSFQRPGMQKDSSRSLPQSRRMRSSEGRKRKSSEVGQTGLGSFPPCCHPIALLE